MAPNTTLTHALWQTITTLGGLIVRNEADAGDSQARIYAIHTDHLGTPQAVTDEHQHIVWQAETTPFGQAKVTYAKVSASTTGETIRNKVFEMSLRLPGQVYDAETGLNQNYYRDYDPTLGRYTTPDPTGIEGGLNPYAYVNSNPLTNIDPLGLYESDIHYYMTFFLAMAAGVSYDDARTIAFGDEYVDDNPLTRPVDGSSWLTTVGSIFVNQNKLLDYHFTLSSSDKTSSGYGKTDGNYQNSDLTLPSTSPSAQLANLIGASEKAPTGCGQLQFFGEYLHAFEDTFSHRQKNNKPYDALDFGLGIGHGLDGHEPDYTYDNDSNGWNMRSARTLVMEEEVFNKLKSQFGDSTKAMSWDKVKAVADEFNKTHEDESDKNNFKVKLKILNDALVGYTVINPDKSTRAIDLTDVEKDKYEKGLGDTNRNKNLCDKDGQRLKQWDYAGTMLPGTVCPP